MFSLPFFSFSFLRGKHPEEVLMSHMGILILRFIYDVAHAESSFFSIAKQ